MEAKGTIITYRTFNQNDREEYREVKFISKQGACDWLTEQWPTIQRRMGAVITDIKTDTPVFYPQSEINYMDAVI
jgi:hypothetical protein